MLLIVPAKNEGKIKKDALQKCLSLKIRKLDTLYFYFARFWQYMPIRESSGKNQKKLPVGATRY